jgi:hypothetical protein
MRVLGALERVLTNDATSTTPKHTSGAPECVRTSGVGRGGRMGQEGRGQPCVPRAVRGSKVWARGLNVRVRLGCQ